MKLHNAYAKEKARTLSLLENKQIIYPQIKQKRQMQLHLYTGNCQEIVIKTVDNTRTEHH